MLLATFNVNSVRTRLPILIPWMQKTAVDCLCLQETKVTDDQFPLGAFMDAGYHASFHGEKSYNGVAIITRFTPDRVTFGFDGAGQDEGTRLMTVSWKGVTIVNTYVPQGTSPDSEKFIYKLDWFGRLARFFDGLGPEGIIWCGDFNVAPEDRDVHSPKKLRGSIGFHPREHEALAAVRESRFVDVFRKHCDADGEYTFWDYRVPNAIARGLGWRVDHIWASEDTASRSIRSWIDRSPRLMEKPSDHTPLLAEFNVA